ncbi:hypothetical protein ASPWEDRAFT_168213 [Aspergillus wentii DTO 134E9]|uniref:HNH nuclease domain-containing protein n=1 Tax=Aspergillus wentii DTO 134E9 TaxID=1073089 RepID=A0A1L9RTW0_ASPWE|nr:uncharacterized protein ASPWEDRAFT_168213 [Aspergillus wentii DTO 134E9]KAI9933938.1 hypothetical protein MW887_005010 [Aspergillus wentii]OJJ38298.1 hypothetical protein ASPWEDRAFT_168213 [Aspergillus wentii DTO 134E9]
MPDAATEFNESGREDLIRELGRALGLERFNLSAWLLLWFSDVQVLRDLVTTVTSDKTARDDLHGYLSPGSKNFDEVIKAWLVERKDISRTGRASPATDFDSLCRKRDQKKSVVTKGRDVLRAAGLFPSVLGERENTYANETFWKHLGLFWSTEKIEAWQKAAQEQANTLENYITMASGVHRFWEMALFALKPIAKTENSLTLQFFWMSSEIRAGDNDTSISVLAEPSFPCSSDSTPKGSLLFCCDTEERICSGRAITLYTENSDTHPLPSWDLMEMQWMFQRIAALRGTSVTEDRE